MYVRNQKRSRSTTSRYDDAEEDKDADNIYDLPKMPPVPVALPPPQRYANEEQVT
jgi:hypothetical protein